MHCQIVSASFRIDTFQSIYDTSEPDQEIGLVTTKDRIQCISMPNIKSVL